MMNQDLFSAVSMIDLTKVKLKIMEPAPEGQGWTAAQTAEAATWYKRFLFLCGQYPDEPIVPNLLIDQLWHQREGARAERRSESSDAADLFEGGSLVSLLHGGTSKK